MRRALLLMLAIGCGAREEAACHSLAQYTCLRLFRCSYQEPDVNACVAKRAPACEAWPVEKSVACEAAIREQDCQALHEGIAPEACK